MDRGHYRVGEIPSLTALRFIAAACIILGHAQISRFLHIGGIPIDIGILGMPLFFCLSGFIIHYVYAGEFRDMGWSRAVGRFAFARFSRLYPLFVFFFAYYVTANPNFAPLVSDPAILLSYLSLTASWWYWQRGGDLLIQLPYGISWSIATEWFFYFAYAFGLYRLARLPSTRVVIMALIVACTVSFALVWPVEALRQAWEPLVAQIVPGFIGVDKDPTNSFFRWLLYVSPYFHVWEFIGGVLTAETYFRLSAAGGLSRRLTEALFWGGIAWIVVALVIYCNVGGGGRLREYAFLHFLFVTHMTCLFAPGVYAIILACALGNCVGARALTAKPLVAGGDISYALYLGGPIGAAFVPDTVAGTPLGVGLKLLVGCVLATGLYAIIELPAKRWLRTLAAWVLGWGESWRLRHIEGSPAHAPVTGRQSGNK